MQSNLDQVKAATENGDDDDIGTEVPRKTGNLRRIFAAYCAARAYWEVMYGEKQAADTEKQFKSCGRG